MSDGMTVGKAGKKLGLAKRLKTKTLKHWHKEAILVGIALLIFILSFPLGRYPVSPDNLFLILAAKIFPIPHTWPATMDIVVFNVRLPRIFAAMLVGAALAASGAAYQGMFKNPLVSPDILGASAGAGFGAAMGIYFSFNVFGIQLSSFIFGLIAVMLTYFISRKVRLDPTLVLVLTGVLVGTMFSSATSLIKFVADPYDKLPAITFWLMGSLAAITPQDVLTGIIPILLGGIPLYILRWRLNVLSLGEEEAMAMGLETRKLRLVVILCSTLMTAAAVSISGLVGWVGLIVPHWARMIVGPNYKILLPTSIILGGAYLLLVDDLARCVASVEIPLGILTALIGAPFFFYLLVSGRKGGE
ncbi:iron complex transport system permease protein [Desulfotomaculum arcticum]|uniref:Iron complex transport system permease protein n=1 Tax=Desulfotruncus arcticus DSM 17038 TaxID=1121424 RepID=A0A1I2X8U7_9FIRM|nr:iron ABC transporter permease [Desulfotruncus arcticus]SFH09925.1 iron complex transport system permease protein [Desulfotomaculum arcticum] [Desulfotruncus arcticus DSM 17038]